jgi:hypothetical protein
MLLVTISASSVVNLCVCMYVCMYFLQTSFRAENEQMSFCVYVYMYVCMYFCIFTKVLFRRK